MMTSQKTTRDLSNHLSGLARPAVILTAIAALSSCVANPAPGPSVAYDASNALPPLGDQDTVQKQEPQPSNGAPFFDLSHWEKQNLQIAKKRAAASSDLDSAVDTQVASREPVRPPIIWTPARRSDEAEAIYSGPGGGGVVEGPLAPLQSPALNQTPTPQHAANGAPPILRLTDLIPSFKSQLAMQAADSSSPLREHLVAASLLMLDDQRRTDPSTLFDLTDREREVLSAYQDYYVRMGEALRAGGGVEAVVKETQEVGSALTTEGRLRIAEFRLCSRIVNYGLFDEIESYKFAAMRPTPLLTYVEIEGFKSVPAGEGKYITRVRHELELYTERDGELVYSWPAAPAEDVCGKVRRDFFLPRQIQLPSNLTMGRYRLKVRIVDEQSQNQAESVVAFSIVAGGDVATRP